MSTADSATAGMSGTTALPPVLGRLLSGTFWLALRVPLQVVFSLWTTRLILQAIGPVENGAYGFAWGFGFFQFLFEFGASSALQRQISDAWTRGDRDGVDRAIACGLTFYTAMAVLQVAALLSVAYLALPHTTLQVNSYPLVVKLLWLQAVTAPCLDSQWWYPASSRRPGGTTSCRDTSWQSSFCDFSCWYWASEQGSTSSG